jgi:hypothetical protein
VFYSNRNGNDDLFLMTRDGEERALITTLANEREPSLRAGWQRGDPYASDVTGSFQLSCCRSTSGFRSSSPTPKA